MNRKTALGISVLSSFIVVVLILGFVALSAQAVNTSHSLEKQFTPGDEKIVFSSLDQPAEVDASSSNAAADSSVKDYPDFVTSESAGLTEDELDRMRMVREVKTRPDEVSIFQVSPSAGAQQSSQYQPNRQEELPGSKFVYHPTYQNSQAIYPVPIIQPEKADRNTLQSQPASINAVYSITLETIHQNTNGNGHSSAFVFTNTDVIASDYYLDFYWLNGDFDNQQGPFNLNPGESQSFDMGTSPFGGHHFVGWIIVSGNASVEGIITTLDYSYISGVVYEDDGTTIFGGVWVSLCTETDCDMGGGSSLYSDGVYYAGGLLDENYTVNATPDYPWAQQWYDNKHYPDQMDTVPISGGGNATGIDFILQPGGKITGTVYDSTGTNPLENVNIDLDQGWYGTCTDANGVYEINQVPYGDQVVVAGQGYNWCTDQNSIYIQEYYSEAEDYDSATMVTVSSIQDIVTDIDFTLDEGGIIIGRVTAADGGAPLENVHLNVDEYDNRSFGYNAYTDANGYYTATGLIPGDYMVEAYAGYPYTKHWYDNQVNEEQADRISISAGEIIAGIDLVMPPGGMITGYVYANDGSTPLENINVDLNQGSYGTCTDVNGYYELQGVPYGDQIVNAGGGWNWCQDQNSIYIQEYYFETYNRDDATPINISSGDDIAEDINFTLDEAGVVKGRVTDSGGMNGLSNADVSVDEYENNDFNYGTQTDSIGYYTITGVIPADYRIIASAGYPYAQQYYNGHDNHNDADRVSIALGDVFTANFALDPGGMITGYVYDSSGSNPLANINVRSRFSGTCTDANGYYEVQGIPYGAETISASGGWNWCQDQESIYIREYYFETYNRDDATPININSGDDIAEDINFNLDVGGVIIGRVTDADTSNPLENADVWADEYDNNDYGVHTNTDANGYYTLTGIVPTDYMVQSDAGYPYARNWYDNKDHGRQADRLPISAGEVITGIDFAMQPGGMINGYVFAADGTTPLENINVDLEQGWYGTCTDSNGYYEMYGIPYGDQYVRAGGDWNWCQDQNSIYIRKYYDDVYNRDDANPLNINSGTDIYGDINFTMETGGSILGRVTDESNGDPLADVYVDVNNWPDEDYGTGNNTDANGYYTVTGLLDGDYVVSVRNPDMTPLGYGGEYYDDELDKNYAAVLTISGSNTIDNINIELGPGGAITGVVTEEGTGLPLANVKVNVGIRHQHFGFGTCTNSQGEYAVQGMPYADYVVSAADGWNWCKDQPSEYAVEYYNEQTRYDDAEIITIDDGSRYYGDINFTLEEGGYITGTVINQDTGQPIEGLRMEALLPSYNCPWCYDHLMDTDTDSNGQYTLGPLPPLEVGIYACADCSGLLLVSEFYSDAYDIESADLISVAPGTTLGEVDFSLDSGILITGYVTVLNGYDNSGIQINVWKNDGFNYNGWTETDEIGFYQVPVPPIYDSRWAVEAYPWGTDLEGQRVHGFYLSEHTSWDFDLGLGSTITGYVMNNGSPVQDANVNAESVGNWYHNGTNTDSSGYFEISNLPPVEYRLGADGGWNGYMQTYYGGFEWDWATIITLDRGETKGGYVIELPELGQLEGHVYEADGVTPLEGVQVTAMNSNGYWMGWSQVDGYFSIDLPAGDHKVRFGYEDWHMTPVFYPDSSTHSGAMTVTVPVVDSSLYISQTMQNWGTLHGQVTDADTGNPIEGIHVSATNIDPTVDRMSSDGGCTDENGEYEFIFWPGGDIFIEVVGTCGAYEYESVTTTLTTVPGGDYAKNFSLTAVSMPDLPFTIRTTQLFGFTPVESGGGVNVNDIDQILPALYTPIAQLDDNGDWYSELLVQIPTVDNGGVAIIGDQMVVTYTLESGLLWSDGETLTSEDVRFAWEFTTYPNMFGNSYNAQIGDAWHIESVTTPDDLTVVMTYDPDYRTASYMGAIPYALPEHVLNGMHPMDIGNSEYDRDPVGNGPYVVENWVPRSHIDLRPNINYHKRAAGFPKIEEVRILFENSHPFWSLVNGTVDVSINMGEVPDVYEESWGLVDIATIGSWGFDAFIPNTELPLFQDPDVRNALNYALDRDTLVENNPFTVLPADGWIPRDHPMHPESITPYTFDLTTAASMLDASGWVISATDGIRYKDGLKFAFDLYYPEGNEHRQIQAFMYHDDLESIGIDVTLVEIPWNEIIDNLRYGRLDMTAMGWGFDNRYDPLGYNIFHSDQIPTAYNDYTWSFFTGRWQNAVNDTLLYSTTQEIDMGNLKGLYEQQLTLFNSQMPILPTKFYVEQHGSVPTLLNFKPGGNTPITWNIEEWEQPDNPYDLSVRKALALDSPAPQPGTTITYEIKVRNQGYFTVTGSTLVDELQSNVVFAGAEPAPNQVDGSQLTWDLGDIPGNTSYGVIELAVSIPAAPTFTHGMTITNQVEVFGDQTDTHNENNGFVHVVEVSEDVDLDINKIGVGQPAIGEDYSYYIDYANWGGAPASGVVITDTLPPEVNLKNVTPAYSGISGDTITWTLPTLAGNQWGGQIQINVEITASGTATNNAWITEIPGENTFDNNFDDHVEEINDILAPVILRPTQGTVDQTPTVSGLAPSNSVVDLYDLDGGQTWLMSTTATVSGTFSMELNLAEGSYIFAAAATKDGLTSELSSKDGGSATVDVDHNLPLDPDYVTIQADGVDMSAGAVRANKYTLARRLLDIEAKLTCSTTPNNVHLDVTENGTFYYNVPLKNMTGPDGNDYQVHFQFWMGNPHSTYDVWIEWTCDSFIYRENLMYILIDPDGYLYDLSLVEAGSTITDSILINGIITAYVRTGDEWIVWPAHVYGQTNPQKTDNTTDDGVIVAGYYSFLTPPGQYYLVSTAPGYQPYQSEILTVITEVIHLDIGLMPIQGGSGLIFSPPDLSSSYKMVDKSEAWHGDILTYTIHLENTGGEETGTLDLTDAIPDGTQYVTDSVSANGGTVDYNSITDEITWTGTVSDHSVDITFSVLVNGGDGTPFMVENTAEVASTDLTAINTLPTLFASTNIQNQVGFEFDGSQTQEKYPSDVVVYQHVVTNTSNYTETFVFIAKSSNDWLVEKSRSSVLLGVGESTTLVISITIPSATSQIMDTTTITATSQTFTNFTQTVDDLTTIILKIYLPLVVK